MNSYKNIENSFEIRVNFLCVFTIFQKNLPFLHKRAAKGKNKTSKASNGRLIFLAAPLSENKGAKLCGKNGKNPSFITK